MTKIIKNHEKTRALNHLKDLYKNCTACPLAFQGRTQVVFGTGNSNASLILVGEAPGKDEDKKGIPFIGKAGKLLTELLKQAEFNRNDIYISNVAKCRPQKNRPPTAIESSTCSKLLLFAEINIIQPKIICTLGATATQALLGPNNKIGIIRGTFCHYKEYLIVPTYHPAYLLRDPSKKNIVINDLKKINKKIKELNAQ